MGFIAGLVGMILLVPLTLFACGWRPSVVRSDDIYLGPDLRFADGPYGGLVLRHPQSRRLNCGISWNSAELLIGIPTLHVAISRQTGLDFYRSPEGLP